MGTTRFVCIRDHTIHKHVYKKRPLDTEDAAGDHLGWSITECHLASFFVFCQMLLYTIRQKDLGHKHKRWMGPPRCADVSNAMYYVG